jgi:hypothetical protein
MLIWVNIGIELSGCYGSEMEARLLYLLMDLNLNML